MLVFSISLVLGEFFSKADSYRMNLAAEKDDHVPVEIADGKSLNMGSGNNVTAFIMCNVGEEGIAEVWYLDSGCSKHMSGNETLFLFIDKSFKSKIKMGNNGTLPVVGKGSIFLALFGLCEHHKVQRVPL